MAKKKNSSMNAKVMFLLFLFFIASVLFLPTTFVFFFGMFPTWALFVSDKSPSKLKSLAIGVMNFAGVMYVLLSLWTKENTIEFAVKLVLNPESIIVMYTAAAVGYLIQSTVSAMTRNIVMQQTHAKLKEILKTEEELEKRWGYEVTGKVALDSDGFPVEDEVKK